MLKQEEFLKSIKSRYFQCDEKVYENNKDKVGTMQVFYMIKALLIEGFSIDNPVNYQIKFVI